VVAGFNGNRRTALVLLAAGADVNATDEGGTTALMAASALGHGELVDLLLVAGADVNLKDAGGKSALARATLAGHGAIVAALKAAGAVEGDDASQAQP
jgi:ankyrin repeat protein